TGFVSTMRVVEGKHFPTDVIAGSIIGMGVGVLVPHFHRASSLHINSTLLEDGVVLGLSGHF
ncbi:MAG: phosphatase PAP2 family protein, partial [Myxococcota bacterium]